MTLPYKLVVVFRTADHKRQANQALALEVREEKHLAEQSPTCIDLFSGCGGLSLGMLRAGFKVLAAIDNDPVAVATLKANLVDRHHPDFPPVTHLIQRDLTTFDPVELVSLIGVAQVDVIVGGPPCQGFSTARQVDGANHGSRLKADPRRHLYQDFLRFVDYFQPRVFVLENVLGIRTAADGEYFTKVQKEARELGRADGRPGYRVHSQIEDAWELGVPQKRRRQLIIGVRDDLPGYFLPTLNPAPRAKLRTNLGAAIGDLPILRAGGGEDVREYDGKSRSMHLRKRGSVARNYLFRVLEVARAEKLTNHVARPHSERDLRDFARLREGENSSTAMRERGVEFEFPYKRHHFKDRYTRQHHDRSCSTIVAHLSKDGLMFIHPTQNRTLSPREAARVQSFPDWFRFPSARTHAFRIIGNAVPPLVAESVGLSVKDFLVEQQSMRENFPNYPLGNARKKDAYELEFYPLISQYSHSESSQWLACFIKMDRRALRELPSKEFLRGWHAVLYLFPSLHPDNARDHGEGVETIQSARSALPGFENVFSLRYTRSGWPVALEVVGREAWRRYLGTQISEEEFYCNEAQQAGMMAEC